MMKKIKVRSLEKPIQKHRMIIQLLFVLLCIWIGIEFHLFVKYLESGGTAEFYERPPGAESFLPISSLMSLYYLAKTGIIHNAHPAGLFILLAIVGVSFVFGKSFCGWICPVGALSEYIADFGDNLQNKLFKKVYRITRWLDYPLRSIKYLLLAFFVYAIFFAMSELALKSFLDSSYNVISDVKMYYFFAEISQFALTVILVLFVFSIFARNFWCRYLCPYGALLGIFSILSPNKIQRNLDSCIDCELCAKACPSRIKVDKVKTVISDECSTCMSCVDVCPAADTLNLKFVAAKKPIQKKLIVFGIIGIFVWITALGMLSKNWQNNISKEEYLNHFKNKDSIGHPRSTEDIKELNKQLESGDSNGRNKFSK
ncbi:MAG: 4Fe-4S binding protein [Bacteroidetes bacterium]|nr:4Fe-4S binding protein [Bacteroidota bacterium]